MRISRLAMPFDSVYIAVERSLNASATEPRASARGSAPSRIDHDRSDATKSGFGHWAGRLRPCRRRKEMADPMGRAGNEPHRSRRRFAAVLLLDDVRVTVSRRV